MEEIFSSTYDCIINYFRTGQFFLNPMKQQDFVSLNCEEPCSLQGIILLFNCICFFVFLTQTYNILHTAMRQFVTQLCKMFFKYYFIWHFNVLANQKQESTLASISLFNQDKMFWRGHNIFISYCIVVVSKQFFTVYFCS